MDAICPDHDVAFEDAAIFCVHTYSFLQELDLCDSFLWDNFVFVLQVVVENLQKHLPVDEDGRVTKPSRKNDYQ